MQGETVEFTFFVLKFYYFRNYMKVAEFRSAKQNIRNSVPNI